MPIAFQSQCRRTQQAFCGLIRDLAEVGITKIPSLLSGLPLQARTLKLFTPRLKIRKKIALRKNHFINLGFKPFCFKLNILFCTTHRTQHYTYFTIVSFRLKIIVFINAMILIITLKMTASARVKLAQRQGIATERQRSQFQVQGVIFFFHTQFESNEQ